MNLGKFILRNFLSSFVNEGPRLPELELTRARFVGGVLGEGLGWDGLGAARTQDKRNLGLALTQQVIRVARHLYDLRGGETLRNDDW